MIPPAQKKTFVRVLGNVARLRDRSLPWVLIVVLVVAWTILQPVAGGSEAGHEAKWASSGEAGGLGFGGWWLMYVSRPIFGALLAAWAWRLALTFLLLKRIARLDLSIVPTHPDGAAAWDSEGHAGARQPARHLGGGASLCLATWFTTSAFCPEGSAASCC
jgi:hypothetical protein